MLFRSIRALRDVGAAVKAGDLGGFVEGEWNLSYEDADSWIAMMPSPPMGPVWRAGASSGIKRWSAAKLVFGECP